VHRQTRAHLDLEAARAKGNDHRGLVHGLEKASAELIADVKERSKDDTGDVRMLQREAIHACLNFKIPAAGESNELR
jgi:hypothetical protein